MVITRIVPLSAARVAAMVYAFVGVVAGAVLSVAALAGMMAAPGEGPPFGGMIFGLGAVIMLPILYACFGFIGTLVMTWAYNLVAGAVGGIEVDVR